MSRQADFVQTHEEVSQPNSFSVGQQTGFTHWGHDAAVICRRSLAHFAVAAFEHNLNKHQIYHRISLEMKSVTHC